MIEISVLRNLKDSLLAGNLNLLNQEAILLINQIATKVLSKSYSQITHEEIEEVELIILISNILYNNTDRSILPLEDGVYDLLMSMHQAFNPNYIVGAPPVDFKSTGGLNNNKTENLIIPGVFMDKDRLEDTFFLTHDRLLKDVRLNRKDILKRPGYFEIPIEKKTLNIPHTYPNLVGTLDKCKFVMNEQAREKNVFDDANVKIFERDFLGKHLNQGLFGLYDEIELDLELKYDGVSVEAEVSDRVISACSRGDTNNDISADLTPIFKDYLFRQAVGVIPRDEIFGMQFEAIIDNYTLGMLNKDRETPYKNPRNTIIGILGSLDGYKYRDMITLVPIRTSLEGISRVEEIEFMNKYYRTNEYLRYAIVQGNYYQLLYQVKRFVEEAEYLRPFLPFMYDGVVVSYTDPVLREKLGRINSVNQYQMAIKFNALKKQTVFTGYTYTVGSTGTITPMAHFLPVEFFGTIHDKASCHSFDRFNKLSMREGDIIDVEYSHDVMAYISKPDNGENDNNNNPIIPFPMECPSCGGPIRISESGKKAECINRGCPDRNLSRIVNMGQRLGLKDFSEESLRGLGKFSLAELLNTKLEDVQFLGEVNSKKFIDRIEKIKVSPIADYKIISSVGFTGIASEKWRMILKKIPLSDIINNDDNILYDKLITINGIGPSTAKTIVEERYIYLKDLLCIFNMPNVEISFGDAGFSRSKIRFTGIRDAELSAYLESLGFDANPDAGVTKDTDILIIPEASYSSTKVDKAIKYGIQIVQIDLFKADLEQYLDL